jgi:hypothetical protein
MSLGGTVLANPVVVPIVWDGDPLANQLVHFANRLGASSYWRQATLPYGVGAASAGITDVEMTTRPTSLPDSQIRSSLAGALSGGGTINNPPGPNTLYVFFAPPGVTVTKALGANGTDVGSSCVAFLGYHDWLTLSSGPYQGTSVAYAVVPRCPRIGAFTTDLDQTTTAASHEIAEAATDPHRDAWVTSDYDDFGWALLLGGGEIGDFCDMNSFTPTDLGYAVQRLWSNSAAAQGQNPCIPSLDQPYFASPPVLSDTLDLTVGSTTIHPAGVRIPVNSSATLELDLFSDAPTNGPWTVKAIEPQALAFQAPPTLELALDRTSGENGDRLHLTVTVLRSGQLGGVLDGFEGFVIGSRIGTQVTYWPVLVESN